MRCVVGAPQYVSRTCRLWVLVRLLTLLGRRALDSLVEEAKKAHSVETEDAQPRE